MIKSKYKYMKYKEKYLNLKENCLFNEKVIKKIIEDNVEPSIKININNLNEDNDQLAFGILKMGNKKGECFNDYHYQNAISVFKKQIDNDDCIFNYILKIIKQDTKKNIFLIDGMNFITIFMKYLIKNKNNEQLIEFYKNCRDIMEFIELSRKIETDEIEKILENDKEIGKNHFSKNLFRINFLKECFDIIFSKNTNDLYIIFHHGFNYVASFVNGKLNREYNENLYQNVDCDKNYILVSTYLKNSVMTYLQTYKGKLKSNIKTILKEKREYNLEYLENTINNEIKYKLYFKQKNDQILKDIENKYFDFINTNNYLSPKVCKSSNETDDYCIIILYYYLKYQENLHKVFIVSNDQYGWTKNSIIDENIIKFEEFLINKFIPKI